MPTMHDVLLIIVLALVVTPLIYQEYMRAQKRHLTQHYANKNTKYTTDNGLDK